MIKRFLFVGLASLALARPETYKENEEFNYARSSTDEGSKSGFYEAQRGNVGGNFERAHNMDHLAQGQMSDLVNQVGSQAVDATDANRGNLYGAGYTRGVYGRNHDTSNIANRNFQENVGQSVSSSSSQYGQYQKGTHGSHSSGSLQQGAYGLGSSQRTYGTGSEYERTGYGSSQQLSSSGYHQQSGLHQRATSNLDSVDQTYQQSGQTATPYRIVPVRIVVRPMEPVKIPVQAQAIDQMVESGYNQRNEQHSMSHAQNTLTQREGLLNTGSDVEALNIGEPGKEKHYESSFNYHKEWEKHSEVTPVPLSIPTLNPLSESLYNQQQHNLDFDQQEQYRLNHHNSNQRNIAADSTFVDANQGLNTYQSGANEKRYESGYNYKKQWEKQSVVASPNTQHRYVVLAPSADIVGTDLNHGEYGTSQSQQAYGSQSRHASNYRADSRSESQAAYAHQALDQNLLRKNQHNLDRAALVAITNNNDQLASGAYGSEPKKYESSYSYHKSWERQGDPYIIQPSRAVAGTSERLQAQGSHYAGYPSYGQQEDCEENQRKVRSARYNDENEYQQAEDIGQQVEEVDWGQQVQSTWDGPDGLNNKDKNAWGDEDQQLETTRDSQKQEELAPRVDEMFQQSENPWVEHLSNEHDVSQPLESSAPHKRKGSSDIDDLGQQTMTAEDSSNTEDLGQQVQNGWENTANFEQNSNSAQNAYDVWQNQYKQYVEHNMGQIEQAAGDLQQHTQNNWSPSGQQYLDKPDSEKYLEQGQSNWKQYEQNFQHSYAHTAHETTLQETNYQETQHYGNHNEQSPQTSSNHDESEDFNGRTVLRGDLGTDKPTQNKIKSSTIKPILTDDEFDTNLKEILSDVYKFKVDSADKSESNQNDTGFSVAPNSTQKSVKTPEEIESLSLTESKFKENIIKNKTSSSVSRHQERDIQSSYVPIAQDYHSHESTNTMQEEQINIQKDESDFSYQVEQDVQDQQEQILGSSNRGSDRLTELYSDKSQANELSNKAANTDEESKKMMRREEIDQEFEDLGQESISFDRNSINGQVLESINPKWKQSEQDLNLFNVWQQSEYSSQQAENVGENLEPQKLRYVDKLGVNQKKITNPSASAPSETPNGNQNDLAVMRQYIQEMEQHEVQLSDPKVNNPQEEIASIVAAGRMSDVGVTDKVTDQDADTNSGQDTETMDEQSLIPPEGTETSPKPAKQGFWKSVGNKFSRAKDTVSSWFSKPINTRQ